MLKQGRSQTGNLVKMSEAMGTGVPEPQKRPPPPDAATPPPRDYPFQFSGSGSEFFRIWIVNVALTIVTLGIYSAWAKVRTNRYIYGNTTVAGGNFDYHASPIVILRGRVIALVMLLAYTLLQNFFPIVGPILIILIFLALPWIVIRAMAFNARNTSWRNVRFNFTAEPTQAFGAYVGWPLVGIVTLGLAMPYAWYKAARFGVDNHRLGQTRFKMQATASDFYVILFALFFTSIAVGMIFFAGVWGLSQFDTGSGFESLLQNASLVLYLVVYLVMFNLFGALRFQTIYNDLQLGENRIDTDMTITGYLWVAATNSIAILFTLGLFYPWAKVRMTSFLVESLELQASDVDSFVAAAEEASSALGEEFGEAFDLGIGV